jgi:hypothetical protein
MGESLPTENGSPPGEYLDLELSPDGTQLALERLDSSTNSAHIWLLNLSLGTLKR